MFHGSCQTMVCIQAVSDLCSPAYLTSDPSLPLPEPMQLLSWWCRHRNIRPGSGCGFPQRSRVETLKSRSCWADLTPEQADSHTKPACTSSGPPVSKNVCPNCLYLQKQYWTWNLLLCFQLIQGFCCYLFFNGNISWQFFHSISNFLRACFVLGTGHWKYSSEQRSKHSDFMWPTFC